MACPKDFRLASPRVCTGHFVKGSLSDMYAEVENVGRQTDRQILQRYPLSASLEKPD